MIIGAYPDREILCYEQSKMIKSQLFISVGREMHFQRESGEGNTNLITHHTLYKGKVRKLCF